VCNTQRRIFNIQSSRPVPLDEPLTFRYHPTMAPSRITTTLALESDGPALAALTSVRFAFDPAYKLIWGSTAPGVHDSVALAGLLTPVQQEYRVTYKAVDSESGKLAGFASWVLPEPEVEGEEKPKNAGYLPSIPGANMELWGEKVKGPERSQVRDKTKDMHLSLCFVHPDFQRRGIATLLLKWGLEKADAENIKLWCTSTPQAVKTYEKSGWKVIDLQDIELGKYGGEGTYQRAWMLRLPETKA